MLQDPIADMLCRIRNAIIAHHEKVDIPFSKMKRETIKIIKNEGLVRNFRLMQDEKGWQLIRVFLKYTDRGKPVLSHLERVSSPSRRLYVSFDRLPRLLNGLAVSIISTSSGIMSAAKAREIGIGGEVICHLW